MIGVLSRMRIIMRSYADSSGISIVGCLCQTVPTRKASGRGIQRDLDDDRGMTAARDQKIVDEFIARKEAERLL